MTTGSDRVYFGWNLAKAEESQWKRTYRRTEPIIMYKIPKKKYYYYYQHNNNKEKKAEASSSIRRRSRVF